MALAMDECQRCGDEFEAFEDSVAAGNRYCSLRREIEGKAL